MSELKQIKVRLLLTSKLLFLKANICWKIILARNVHSKLSCNCFAKKGRSPTFRPDIL